MSEVPVFALLLVLVGCGAPEPTAPAAAPPAAVDAAAADAQALADTEAAAKQLAGALKARVQESMGASGPSATIEVCSVEAPERARAITEATGVRVGRGSLRLRNPANAAPDWVGAWLAEQGERPAEGVAPVRRIDDTPEGRFARVLLPIPVEAPCVACHGESIAPEVQATLAARYPEDRATGYRVGDLRGALWAERRLD